VTRGVSLRAPLRPVLAGLALGALAAPALRAQASTSLVSLGVSHSSLKNAAKPSGELKGQIDSLDALIAVAGRAGRTSELRRLYAQAGSLLRKRPWTPEAEYAASLVLRTDRQVVDPSRAWVVRLEQIFAPSIALDRALMARVTLRQRPAGGAPNAPLVVVKSIGTYDAVPRDLRDAPFVVEANLRDVPNGSYVLAVDVMSDSTRALGTASLPLVVRAGLDASIARLEAAAATVAEPVRSDLLFPIDRLRQVNASRIELRTFDAARDFAAAESLLVRVKGKNDPWAGRTGDMKRHYLLEAAGEIMPYRVYIPNGYRPGKPMPLVVALHGLGATEDSFFDQSYGRALPRLAEERGYIVVAPLGYRVDGAYGVFLPGAASDPAGVRARSLSEQDVVEVVQRVRAQYTINAARMFLMGHSMGAIGTWALAMKNPEPWAGLGAFSGFGAATNAKAIAGIPQFVVHGDADNTVSVAGSRTMVTALKAAGGAVTYIEVPGGTHTNVVEPNLTAMFDLFDTLSKKPVDKPTEKR
jgi:predicted esterase